MVCNGMIGPAIVITHNNFDEVAELAMEVFDVV
jgi:hypothetical protein